MKKLFVFVCLNYCFVFLAASISAQQFQTIQDGIEHAKFTRKIKDDPVVVNLLRLDLSKVRLDVVHAMDAAIGTETTSSMATRHGAIAAINAGFFRLDKSIFAGDSMGVLKINGRLFSESYAERIALLIVNRPNLTEIGLAHLNLSHCFLIKGQCMDVGLNRERKENDAVIYTPDFHRTTLTASDGLEVIVKNGRISEIVDRQGSSLIPSDGFVLSVNGQKRKEILPFIKPKAKVGFGWINSSPGALISKKSPVDGVYLQSFKAEDIVGGVPQLIKNGVIKITWEQEKSSKAFIETRHPRTAVAKLKDGKFLIVTVDGRQPGVSVGMNLNELAEMLLEFGASDAMNLDGGGSTTMFLGGKIVNQPSDKEGERKVSDAILVFPRKKN
jgi:exopolysaccharide biosynthesis protein